MDQGVSEAEVDAAMAAWRAEQDDAYESSRPEYIYAKDHGVRTTAEDRTRDLMRRVLTAAFAVRAGHQR
jgi:hypothetical protein